MKRLVNVRYLFLAVALLFSASVAQATDFEKPVVLKAGGEMVCTESPGYAAPCWADIDGDGKKDLLVGQFRGGKIRVFKGLGQQKFAAGKWLQVDGTDVKIPGVW